MSHQHLTPTIHIKHAWLILFGLAISACAEFPDKPDAWEGFHHRTLRVHVRVDSSDEHVFESNHRSINEALLEAAEARASLILASHSRIHFIDQERASSCRSAIPQILRNGVIRFRKCTGDICIAFIDYDAGICAETVNP